MSMNTATPQSRQAKLLAKMIDSKIDARVSGLESTVTKMYRLFRKMKHTAAAKKMLKLESDVQSIREMIEDFNVKHLEEDIFRRVDEMNRKLERSCEKNRHAIRSLADDAAGLRKNLEDARTGQKRIHAFDEMNVKRDLESLKVKTQWLELEFEKMNIRPLLERIGELEARMDALRLTQPTIIE